MARSPSPPGSTATAAALAAQGKGFRILIWTGVFLLTAMLISLPTVMLVFFGLLPSIVAWIIDRSEQKYATFCVLGINFSGLFPYLMDIWFKNHSVDAATEIMGNVFDLFVIYGAAAFGWMVFLTLPPIITTFLSVMSENRLKTLRETQKSIIEEWGEKVVSAVNSIDLVGPNGRPRKKPAQ